MRHPIKGPMPFGAWVAAYEDRDASRFELTEGEELYFDRNRGFFTWAVDFENRLLLIPKMVGDGRFFRPVILEMFLTLRERAGLRAVYCCTKRKPEVYMRVLGGRLVKQEEAAGSVYSYIEITPEDTAVKRRHDDGRS